MNTALSSQTADKVIWQQTTNQLPGFPHDLKLVKGYGASGVFLNRNRDGSGKYPVIHKGAVEAVRASSGSSPQGVAATGSCLKLPVLQPEGLEDPLVLGCA